MFGRQIMVLLVVLPVATWCGSAADELRRGTVAILDEAAALVGTGAAANPNVTWGLKRGQLCGLYERAGCPQQADRQWRLALDEVRAVAVPNVIQILVGRLRNRPVSRARPLLERAGRQTDIALGLQRSGAVGRAGRLCRRALRTLRGLPAGPQRTSEIENAASALAGAGEYDDAHRALALLPPSRHDAVCAGLAIRAMENSDPAEAATFLTLLPDAATRREGWATALWRALEYWERPVPSPEVLMTWVIPALREGLAAGEKPPNDRLLGYVSVLAGYYVHHGQAEDAWALAEASGHWSPFAAIGVAATDLGDAEFQDRALRRVLAFCSDPDNCLLPLRWYLDDLQQDYGMIWASDRLRPAAGSPRQAAALRVLDLAEEMLDKPCVDYWTHQDLAEFALYFHDPDRAEPIAERTPPPAEPVHGAAMATIWWRLGRPEKANEWLDAALAQHPPAPANLREDEDAADLFDAAFRCERWDAAWTLAGDGWRWELGGELRGILLDSGVEAMLHYVDRLEPVERRETAAGAAIELLNHYNLSAQAVPLLARVTSPVKVPFSSGLVPPARLRSDTVRGIRLEKFRSGDIAGYLAALATVQDLENQASECWHVLEALSIAADPAMPRELPFTAAEAQALLPELRQRIRAMLPSMFAAIPADALETGPYEIMQLCLELGDYDEAAAAVRHMNPPDVRSRHFFEIARARLDHADRLDAESGR